LKNYVIFLFRSKLNLNIRGNNVERFIKRLKNNNIEKESVKTKKKKTKKNNDDDDMAVL